jgi:hypothetical protein
MKSTIFWVAVLQHFMKAIASIFDNEERATYNATKKEFASGIFTELHCSTPQKIILFIVITVRTSNPKVQR